MKVHSANPYKGLKPTLQLSSFPTNISRLAKNNTIRTMRTGLSSMDTTEGLSLDQMVNSSWLRHHLYLLGLDLIKLKLYQKFSHLLTTGGGGLIKNAVFELSSFLKRELVDRRCRTDSPESTIASQLKELISFNLSFTADSQRSAILDGEDYRESQFKWFFIAVGYMIVTESERSVEDLADKIISIYMSSTRPTIPIDAASAPLIDQDNSRILSLIHRYYTSVNIDYDLLYRPRPISIRMFDSVYYQIDLPPLPKIENKSLLAKALMHKEMYRAFLVKSHPFSEMLLEEGIEPTRDSCKVIRYDLSFLDGLGDFYLARESSKLLYRFKVETAPPSEDAGFGRKSYNMLRTILATNTLLSKLAVAYNLHRGLNDPIIYRFLLEDYVPNISTWSSPEFDMSDDVNGVMRYEQEFIADYFEQYVGALFLELPDVAQDWINEIYHNILLLIPDLHTTPGRILRYDYRAWSHDVIGRQVM